LYMSCNTGKTQISEKKNKNCAKKKYLNNPFRLQTLLRRMSFILFPERLFTSLFTSLITDLLFIRFSAKSAGSCLKKRRSARGLDDDMIYCYIQ
jgi:hypothetical protein